LNKEGLLLIISGPSGSGKGTVTRRLPEDVFALSISMTTRRKRGEEVDGKHYIFCTEEEFVKVRDEGGLLEHASFSGNFYGTPVSYVKQKTLEGKNVVLEIEVVGALQVKEKYPEAVLIFLMPPTILELRKRLKDRGTESEDEIERRLRIAHEEMAELPKYDYLVINDDIEQALADIHAIVNVEGLKPFRGKCKVDGFYGNNVNSSSPTYFA